MKRNYLAVFEKVAADDWGAFAPDVPGTAERGLQMPEARLTAADFSEFDPGHADLQSVVEWLPLDLPQFATQTHDNAQHAA